MIEPAQRGLAQLLPAGRRHHSVEGVIEGLDDDAKLAQTEVKGPIGARSRENTDTAKQARGLRMEGYDPELPVLKRAGLDVVVELLRVVEVLLSDWGAGGGQLLLARAVRQLGALDALMAAARLGAASEGGAEPT